MLSRIQGIPLRQKRETYKKSDNNKSIEEQTGDVDPNRPYIAVYQIRYEICLFPDRSLIERMDQNEQL